MLSHSAENVRSIYEDQGLLYLHHFLRPTILRQIKQDLLSAEKLALEDLAKNWNSEKVVFFTKNPVKSVSAENSEDFVVTPYFQKSKDGGDMTKSCGLGPYQAASPTE
jgi:hypothetical protein